VKESKLGFIPATYSDPWRCTAQHSIFLGLREFPEGVLAKRLVADTPSRWGMSTYVLMGAIHVSCYSIHCTYGLSHNCVQKLVQLFPMGLCFLLVWFGPQSTMYLVPGVALLRGSRACRIFGLKGAP
jgi:hypothetical protein